VDKCYRDWQIEKVECQPSTRLRYRRAIEWNG